MKHITRKVPQIRFKGFEGEWEDRPLGKLFPITSAARVHKNEWTKSGVPFFRSSDVVSAFMGKVNTRAFISHDLYLALSEKVGRVKKGDMLVTGGGSIGIPYLVENDDPLYFKDADLLWFKIRDSVDSYYLFTFFSSQLFVRYVKSISHIGTIAHYTVEQAKITPIAVPKIISEQTKIGEYFHGVDSLIRLQQRKYEKLVTLKKTMLQKMFPQAGTTTPEIRFKGFSREWAEKKLNQVGEFNPNEKLPEFFEYVDLESVIGTEMVSHRTETRKTAPSRAQRLARQGDLFFQTVRPYQKNNYLFTLPFTDYVFSTGYAQIRPFDDGNFLLALIQRDQFVKVVLDHCTGTSYPAINSNVLAEILVSVPEPEEQQKIGTYFRHLDELISKHAIQLKKLKHIKSACSAKMFP